MLSSAQRASSTVARQRRLRQLPDRVGYTIAAGLTGNRTTLRSPLARKPVLQGWIPAMVELQRQTVGIPTQLERHQPSIRSLSRPDPEQSLAAGHAHVMATGRLDSAQAFSGQGHWHCMHGQLAVQVTDECLAAVSLFQSSMHSHDIQSASSYEEQWNKPY
jgi:hypothetical protein